MPYEQTDCSFGGNDSTSGNSTTSTPPATTPSPSTAGQPTVEQCMPMMEMSVKAMKTMANSIHSNQGQQQQQQQQNQPVNPLNGIKYPHGSFLTAIMGWSGVMTKDLLPKSWVTLSSSKPLTYWRNQSRAHLGPVFDLISTFTVEVCFYFH